MFGKTIQFILAVLVVGAIALHGYFFLDYDTIDACEVAIERIAEDLASNELEKIGVAYIINTTGRKNLANQLRTEVGMVSCYRGGIRGAKALPNIARSYFRKNAN